MGFIRSNCCSEGVTTKSTAAPGVTVTLSSSQMTPKQAVTVCVPTVVGVNNPVESMLPLLADQTTGTLATSEL